MAENNNKVEEPVIDESESVVEEPTIELDRPTDVDGELVENPTLEVEDETDDTQDGDGTDDSETGTSGDGTEDDSSTEEGSAEASGDDESTVPEPTPELAEPTPPLPNPGDFQPRGDYGFEVITADGKTVKINTVAEAEAFADRLDSEENLLSARQFIQFNRNVSKMDRGVEREQETYETQKEAFETQQRQEQVRNEQVGQWNNEINYLATKGLIPEITSELNASNWTDPTVAEQAPVKERLAIFKWMETENNARREAGISEITSAVDAFSLMKAESQETVASEEKNAEVTERQARGKMVSGNSSFIPEASQKDSIVGEGGSLRDLVTEFSAQQ